MYWQTTDQCEKPEPTKATKIVCSKLENILWTIRREVEDPDKQEEYIIKFISSLSWYKDIRKLAEKLLDIDKKYELAELDKDDIEKEEEKIEEWKVWVIFESL